MGSQTTGRIDEGWKRRDYARFQIPEYWRFDLSGGDFHSAHLAGGLLVGEEYEPIPIQRTEQGHFWGHSDVLNLDLCWEDGQLRWYDPVARGYLVSIPEEREARLAAETRVRELQEELRHLRGE